MGKIFPLRVFPKGNRTDCYAGENILIFLHISKRFITDNGGNCDGLELLVAFQEKGIADSQRIAGELFRQALRQTEIIPQIIQRLQGIILQLVIFHLHTFFPVFFPCSVVVELEGIGVFPFQREFIGKSFTEAAQFHRQRQGHNIAAAAHAKGKMRSFLVRRKRFGDVILLHQVIQTFPGSHFQLFFLQPDGAFPAGFLPLPFFRRSCESKGIGRAGGDGERIDLSTAVFP